MNPTVETVSRYDIVAEPDRLRITERPRGFRFGEEFWALLVAGGGLGALLTPFAMALLVEGWRGVNGASFVGVLPGVLVLLAIPALAIFCLVNHLYGSKRLEIDAETFSFERQLFGFRRTWTGLRETLTKVSSRSGTGRETSWHRVGFFWKDGDFTKSDFFSVSTISEQKRIFETLQNFLQPETAGPPLHRADVSEDQAGRIRARCIRCDSLLASENTSFGHGMAKCPACEILFTLEHDLKRHPKPPLGRLELRQTADRLEIRQRRRRFLGLCVLGLLLFLYGLIAYMVSMTWWAYDQGDEFERLRNVAYFSTAISLVAGIPLLLYGYRCLFLTKRLTVDAETIRFRWNLFPFFGGWSTPTADFSDVFYDSRTPFRRGVKLRCGTRLARLDIYGHYEEHLWIVPKIRHFLAGLPLPPVQRLAGLERNEPVVDGFCPKCHRRYEMSEYDFTTDTVRCRECTTETPIDEIFFLEDQSRNELVLTEPEPPEDERTPKSAYRIEEDVESLTLHLEPNPKAFWLLLGLHLFLATFFGGGMFVLVLIGVWEEKPGILVLLTPIFFLLYCFGRMMWQSFKWDMWGRWTVRIDRKTVFCESRCLGYRRIVRRLRTKLDKVYVGSMPPNLMPSDETMPGEGRRLIFRFKDGDNFALPLSQSVKMSREHRDMLLRRVNEFLVSK